jgi:hypothetical protein
MYGPEELPNGVATEGVVLLALVEGDREPALRRCTHRAKVLGRHLHERLGVPPSPASGRDGHPIDAAALDRDIPPDILKALTPEHLAGA